jgi:hypothetical protein
VQVSRILGHASTTITLDVYTHLFERARHGHELRRRLSASTFAELLTPRASAHGRILQLTNARSALKSE